MTIKLIIAIVLILTGVLSVFWPLMPKGWKMLEFVGWIFGASKDPSMGIQYMFFWMITLCYALFAIPVGVWMSLNFFYKGE